MICFAVCVGGDGSRYAEVAEPFLRATAGPDDQIWTTQGAPGICVAYNDFIERARAIGDCDALVLLHDDVEIHDPDFRARILDAVAEPDVAVVGVIGGRDLYNGAWWESRRWGGEAMYTPEVVGNFATRYADVDTVDGFLMVLSRRALDALRFDAATFPAWHGYDADFCLAARRQGLRVVVRPLEVFHRTKATLGDSEAFYEAKRRLVAKYPDLIRRRAPWEWTADTAERARRVVRRKRQAIKSGIRHDNPGPEGQQVSRRAGSRAPELDPSRIQALWLHEAHVDGLVVNLGTHSEFVEAAIAEGFDIQQADDAAGWREAHPNLVPRAVVLFSPFDPSLDPAEVVAEAAALLPPGGVLMVESGICEPEDRGPNEACDRAIGENQLREALAQAGLDIDHFVVMSDAIYRDRESTRERRRLVLAHGGVWPPRDLVRAVARKGGA